MKNFREENRAGIKLNYITALVFHFLVLVLGFWMQGITDKSLELDLYSYSDPFFVSYFKVVAGGIVMGIAVIIVFLLIIGFGYSVDYLVKYLRKNTSNEPSVISRVADSIKNKYCPKINWEPIKKTDK